KGELYTAIKSGFPAERIHFHGNNKSEDELDLAVQWNVGCFVIDNFYEMDLLDSIAKSYHKKVKSLIRLSPGVEAHTHEYIQTGQQDSKFGFDMMNGQAYDAAEKILSYTSIEWIGVHCHIGSQIFEVDGFVMAVQRLAHYMQEVKQKWGHRLNVINVGGGFGIRYEVMDEPLPIEAYVNAIVDTVQDVFQSHILPEIWIEPGRSIVGEAGTTLYTVGSSKHIPGVRHYLSVDGGMTDNPRPALYQAKYEAMIANRGHEEAAEEVSIAGKCCESGDMLIWDVKLALATPGDILAVSSTGAYNYSMASNYNRLTRPAVILVKDGNADVIVERESLDDLIQKDRIPERMMQQIVNS
ncbi:MAG: diaminopimelate decarboxylase, partial [Bacilli bacterium]